MRPPLAFCVAEALDTPEFFENILRLSGYRVASSPIEVAVDKETGYDKIFVNEFIEFVRETVWSRLPE